MSDISAPTKARPDAILIVALIVIVGFIFFAFSGQSQQRLRASPVGFDGLGIWLENQGHDAQAFAGGWTVNVDTIGLSVMPIFDTQLDLRREAPTTQEELLFQQDEYDLDTWSVLDRADMVQSMIVLPKWRSGVRLTGLGHPVLLADRTPVQTVLQDLFGVGVGKLNRIPQPFNDFEYEAGDGTILTARLYVAQVFEGRGCIPIIGDVGQMVLGRCPLSQSFTGDDAYVLSDPDLFSNHGLRLGDNALIASDLLPILAEGERIFIDYSRDNWLTETRDVVQRDRTWSDLLRFFEYPFSVLWLGGALTMLIVLWRAGLRYGPIQSAMSKLSASKMQAIAARARLMRKTGHDGALLSDYVSARMAAVSTGLFGTALSGAQTKERAYLKHMARQKPDLTETLRNLLAEIRNLPPNTPASAAITYVDAFERTLEQLAHDT